MEKTQEKKRKCLPYMKEIGVVEVMGQLFNSMSTPTRWNGSKSWNVIFMSLFTAQKREGEKEERSRALFWGLCSEEEERSRKECRFVLRALF